MKRKVGSLSAFLRLGPAIRRAAPHLPPAELVALCETAARLRFYDAELFEHAFVFLVAHVRARRLSAEQITSVAASLVELNACNAGVFSAAAAALLPEVGKLPKQMRLQWLKLLAAAGHEGRDDAFELALRTAPLPGGVDPGASDDFSLCWDFVRGGCPRGSSCRWKHPPKRRIDPSLWQALGVEALGHRLLLAKGSEGYRVDGEMVKGLEIRSYSEVSCDI
ncbi:unnamed protein product [Prorocentrum cordatum]|uniref:C3H1-type domain-containing protein n=1 Tax=Prorocentrum cordatum TaxID=2364126 RepID=A0ABN9UNQ8_9DINO|nr:unnamed protein product [Polarella glacialis]